MTSTVLESSDDARPKIGIVIYASATPVKIDPRHPLAMALRHRFVLKRAAVPKLKHLPVVRIVRAGRARSRRTRVVRSAAAARVSAGDPEPEPSSASRGAA